MTIVIFYFSFGGLFALGAIAGHAEIRSIWIYFVFGVAASVVFRTVHLFVTAKTQTRSLTISSNGISTQIGQISGSLVWKQVGVIRENSSFILIVRTNGNGFYIPDRAFTNTDQKAEFLRLARQWATNLT
jgi:hypothetical protein